MAQQSHFANVVKSSNNETSDAAAMFRTVMARSTLMPPTLLVPADEVIE
jgi:hypothetical protein